MKANVLLKAGVLLKARALSCLVVLSALMPMVTKATTGVFYRDYKYIGPVEVIPNDDGSITYDVKGNSASDGYCPQGWKVKNVYNLKGGTEDLSADWLDYYINEGSVVAASWSLSGSTLTISAKSGFDSFAVVYTPWTYSLAYSAGVSPASGSTAGMTGICYTNKFTLSANGFSRTGYTFGNGWTNSAGQAFANRATVSGESLGVSKDGDAITLYAEWTANSYSISYDENGGTAGSSRPMSATYDGTPFFVSAPMKTGYNFTGWRLSNYDSSTARSGSGATACTSSISSGGLVSTTGGVYFKNLTPTKGATVKLTAQWNPMTTTITFSGEGASSSTTTRNIEFGQTADGYETVNVPTRDNAQFLGYYTAREGGDKYFDSTGHLVKTWDIAETKVTLYAHWDVNYTRTASLVLNGGTLDQTEVKITIGQAYGDLPVATWKDHKKAFAGWSTETSGGTAVTSSDLVPDPAPATLYAQWTNTLYAARFNGNGSTDGAMSDQTLEFNVSTPLSANAFSRTGYAFAGWATAADATKVVYTNCASVLDLATSAGATVDLYAVWSTNTYYVVFDANGGSGTMPTLTNSYDVAFTLPANKFTRNASEFLAFDHWLDEATDKTYADGENVSNLTATADATVTLKAVWKSTLSDLSAAMHCTTLDWKRYNEKFSTQWSPCSASGAGYNSDSCARQENQAVSTRSPMVAEITANEQKDGKWRLVGVLSFWWKPSGSSSKLQWGVSAKSDAFPDPMSDFGVTVTGTGWICVRQKIDVSMASQNLALFIDNVTGEASGTYECIDQMTWTPGDTGYPAPTDADAVTVSSFAASSDGSGWTLSYAGDDNFAYCVLYADSLASPIAWKPYGAVTNTGATVQSFEIKREASVPTRFFKIETIQRQ